MPTTTDLCKILAGALGIEFEVVLEHARHLHEADGKFPIGEAGTDAVRAEPEHAAALLISLMSGLPPAKASDALSLYGGLPLNCAHRAVEQVDGQLVGAKLQGDDPFMENLVAWGDTFGEFLSCLIAWFNSTPEIDFEVISFVLGGRPGTTSAIIYFAALIEGENVVADVKFSFGTDTIPHDGPRARMETQAIIPGAILSILREFYTSATDGPRKVVLSRADLAGLSQEGSSWITHRTG